MNPPQQQATLAATSATSHHEEEVLGKKQLHQDLITDAAFDHFGTRLATCSVDHQVVIMDLKEGRWVRSQMKGLDMKEALTRIAWCHPSFGTALAVGGLDGGVVIWREEATRGQRLETMWNKLVTLSVDGGVSDLCFAPQHMGLALSVASRRGGVSIYAGETIHDAINWDEPEVTIKLKASPKLSWSKSRSWNSYLAIGCRDPEHGLILYRYYHDTKELKGVLSMKKAGVTDVSFAPSMGRSFLYLAASFEDGWVRIYKLTNRVGSQKAIGSHSKSTAMPVPPQGNTANSSNNTNRAKALPSLRASATGRFGDGPADDDAAKEAKRISADDEFSRNNVEGVELTIMFERQVHIGAASRVAWDMTGMLLASAGQDDRFPLYQCIGGKWELADVTQQQQQQAVQHPSSSNTGNTNSTNSTNSTNNAADRS